MQTTTTAMPAIRPTDLAAALGGVLPRPRPARPVPPPVTPPRRPEHLARAESPVGRVDPAATSPLARLEARLGRPLLDLSQASDAELHAITDALLAEKHRRAAYWLNLAG